jgi:hypothetical protein
MQCATPEFFEKSSIAAIRAIVAVLVEAVLLH